MAIPKHALTRVSRGRLPTIADVCLLIALVLVLALSWHGLPERDTARDLGHAARTAIEGHMDVPPGSKRATQAR